MKNRNHHEQDERIESQIQKAIGYDNETLLQIANDALQKSTEEAAQNTKEMNTDMDTEFELLMLRLKSEKKTPIDEKTYEKNLNLDNQPSSVHKKKLKKVLIVAAAVCLILLGATINVVAKKEHKISKYPGVKNRNIILRNNTFSEFVNDDLDNAYNHISQKLDIPALVLFYIPEDMYFYDFVMYNSHAYIMFYYKEKLILLKESKISEKSFTSITESDRNICQEVYNKWLGENLYIEENILENGEIEYSVNIENNEAFYYFAGIMEKEVFIEIVEKAVYQ